MARKSSKLFIGPKLTASRAFLLFSFVISLAVLLALGFGGARAEEGPSDSSKTEPNALKALTGNIKKSSPLIVPVYPQGAMRKDAPFSNDLRDSYIILEDGSALSVGDWILGGLKKDQSGIAMTDYESRLFLGQVTRAMIGLDQDLTLNNPLSVGPRVPFHAPLRRKGVTAAVENVYNLISHTIFPGTPKDWHPAKTGGAFSPRMRSGGDAAILFENQFAGAMLWSVQDIRDTGVYKRMLDDAKKKAAGTD